MATSKLPPFLPPWRLDNVGGYDVGIKMWKWLVTVLRRSKFKMIVHSSKERDPYPKTTRLWWGLKWNTQGERKRERKLMFEDKTKRSRITWFSQETLFYLGIWEGPHFSFSLFIILYISKERSTDLNLYRPYLFTTFPHTPTGTVLKSQRSSLFLSLVLQIP